ncbi:MAG: helix-turn-helix transcriptional regulator [Verrucomicrobia bacterium]|nr:helix-turn-helix transcriptional regulator [Verrucomicrobiota bacterium]
MGGYPHTLGVMRSSLSASVWTRLSDQLPRLYATRTLDEFTSVARDLAAQFVAVETTSVNVFDLTRRTVQTLHPLQPATQRLQPAFRRHMLANPVLAHYREHGPQEVLQMADFLRGERLERNEFYQHYYRPLHPHFQGMAAPWPISGDICATLAVHRLRRPFSETDRAVLIALRPHLAQAWRNLASSSTARTSWPATLSPRERETLQWLAEGKSNPEIGAILGISPRTVEKHTQRVFEKLGVENRAAALRAVLGQRAEARN